MEVLGIVGSISEESKTRTAVEHALEGAVSESSVETSVLHLAEYDLTTADGRALEEYTGDTAAALNRIIESDAYIIGTPVYRASYSGALKNLFDLTPRGMWQADAAPFANSAVGLIATGATDHHYLSIDEELRPVLSFFGAHTVGGTVYLRNDDFEEGTLTNEELRSRLAGLGQATVELSNAISQGTALATLGPQI